MTHSKLWQTLLCKEVVGRLHGFAERFIDEVVVRLQEGRCEVVMGSQGCFMEVAVRLKLWLS